VDTAVLNAVANLERVLPTEVLRVVRQQLERVLMGEGGGLITVAVAGAIWSSSSAVTAIISALNHAYDVAEWRPWWKRRLIAIGLTIAMSLFVVIAFALVIGGGDLARWVAARAGAGGALAAVWAVAVWALAFVLVVLAIDIVYYFAPNADTKWVWVTPGSLLSTVLWLLASYGFKVYVQNFSSYEAVYGAIGGFIVLMLWFYITGLSLLIGAELNAEIDKALPLPTEAREPRGRRKLGPAAEHADTSPHRL
jgi:membrane protein